MGALAVSSVAAAILNGLGRPKASAGLTVLGLATTILGCLVLIPAAGVMGAATATLIGSLVGLVGLLALLWTSLPGSVPLSTVARACVVGGGVALSARLIPVGTVGLAAALALFGGLTVGLLLVTREVTLNELQGILTGWRTVPYEGRPPGHGRGIYPVNSAPAVRIENLMRGQSRIRVNHDGRQTAGSQLFLADSGAPASRNSVSHAATSTLSSRMRRWFGASVSRSLGSASQRCKCASKRVGPVRLVGEGEPVALLQLRQVSEATGARRTRRLGVPRTAARGQWSGCRPPADRRRRRVVQPVGRQRKTFSVGKARPGRAPRCWKDRTALASRSMIVRWRPAAARLRRRRGSRPWPRSAR